MVPLNRKFILMCGVTHSGKTDTVTKIREAMRDYYFQVIDTRSIHDFLNYQLGFVFRDNNRVDGPRFQMRNLVTKAIQAPLLLHNLIWHRRIIFDASNITRQKRRLILGLVKKFPLKTSTIIIYQNLPPNDLKFRVKLADQRNIQNGEDPAWEQLQYHQLKQLEPPDKREASHLIEFDGKDFSGLFTKLKIAIK